MSLPRHSAREMTPSLLVSNANPLQNLGVGSVFGRGQHRAVPRDSASEQPAQVLMLPASLNRIHANDRGDGTPQRGVVHVIPFEVAIGLERRSTQGHVAQFQAVNLALDAFAPLALCCKGDDRSGPAGSADTQAVAKRCSFLPKMSRR